jgi:hypothetical protein
MINLIIYLKQDYDPVLLVEKLLTCQLIASASIDQNNESFTLKDGTLSREVYNVITAQTKALLFTEIAKLIEGECGREVPVNATPIVASNKIFDELLRSRTLKT